LTAGLGTLQTIEVDWEAKHWRRVGLRVDDILMVFSQLSDIFDPRDNIATLLQGQAFVVDF
jgi:ABC-type antimicrobial peptide transport system ATPase subunit